MGRHRRSGAAPAEADYATGTDRGHGGTRRKRRGRPVRTGLIGASAAVVVGAAAVAVASPGLLPGGETLTAGSAGTSRPTTAESRQAPELTTQGGATRTPAEASTGTGEGAKGTRKTHAPASPEATPTPTRTATATPSPTPSKTRAATAPAKPKPSRTAQPSKAPATTQAAPAPTATTPAPAEETAEAAGSTADRADAAEAEVLRLVNVERAKVGCSPVQPSAGLARLAGAFSADMAARNFFDHTDPDGATPWSRAQAAGIDSLGAENIARGQVDATAVMVSWMNSDGHRANILNCDLTTLGVGVHFADGGPWWTQDFGY
ncbi:CAP domain-containing protein [Streptomyces sp. R302]|uniref:CAP domain-containing protein n=1 Tax=unclassified Streptomyces TaxID=2593676 RepID=UPI00145DF0C8|nr:MULTISPECIES: CAP domain-containing protein [unclassified Streptomyces]NML53301.1 CAP domain-containing protein [Streptomyces sp. R301]NML78255.1 CAP domain-containing protein [Streptomyces sp. R302]